MYDDLHRYSKPGAGAALTQKSDTYDKDAATTSMYDDLHRYGAPGSWKFPAAAKKSLA